MTSDIVKDGALSIMIGLLTQRMETILLSVEDIEQRLQSKLLPPLSDEQKR
jgi:hypothetical protein